MSLSVPARLAVALLLVSCAAAARAPRAGASAAGGSTPHTAAALTGRPTTRTVYEAALRLPEVSEVVTKIDDAGLLEQFLRPNLKITAFLPTNEALEHAEKFISYNPSIINDTKVVRQVLAYHIINRPMRAKDFEFGLNVQPTALGGQPLKITKEEDGTMRIGPYKVIKSDIQAGKSVLHVIDGLLLAPSLIPTMVQADEKRKAQLEQLSARATAGETASDKAPAPLNQPVPVAVNEQSVAAPAVPADKPVATPAASKDGMVAPTAHKGHVAAAAAPKAPAADAPATAAAPETRAARAKEGKIAVAAIDDAVAEPAVESNTDEMSTEDITDNSAF